MSHADYYEDCDDLDPRQRQRRYICGSLSAIWETGGGTLGNVLHKIATYHGREVADLTDDQIESWYEREQRIITQMHSGPYLNG